jgi:hypothetical protein
MSKTQFNSDVDWAIDISIIFFYPLYRELAHEGRFVSIVNSEHSKFSCKLQSREIDVFMQYLQDNNAISIGVEEKAQRKHWDSLWIETDSCTIAGHERTGWIDTLDADYLNYGFGIRDPNATAFTSSDYIAFDAYWIQFPEFKEWFKANIDRFEEKVTFQHNRSAGRIVLIPDLAQSGVSVERFLCERDRCTPISLDLKLNPRKIKNEQLRRELGKAIDNICEFRALQGRSGDDD